MKIISVNIPKNSEPSSQDGLQEIKMDKLGQLVLLAGKNGSGKSRILSKIETYLQHKPNESYVFSRENDININNDRLNHEKYRLKNIEKKDNPENDLRIKNEIKSIKETINSIQFTIEKLEKEKNWTFVVTDNLANQYTPIRFVPINKKLLDPNNYSKNQLIEASASTEKLGITTLAQGALSKIQHIQNRKYELTHPDLISNSKEKERAIKDYDNLKSIIDLFLNTKLERNSNGEALIFGLPIGSAKLSDGQIILLQFCIAIYSQSENLKNSILIMDEPENHVHPSAIIETIDRILKIIPDGQLWIATHSIPILAHYNPSDIWYVENGYVSHSGKTPEKVLESLLGKDEEIERIKDFISLPSQYASSRYAFECLFEPKTVETKPTDKQSLQIKKELLKTSNNEPIKVLDFGAGKGRIISNLFDLELIDDTTIINKINYVAFDEYDKDKESCINNINKVYGNVTRRYYNSTDDILSEHDKNSFHVIIMCNVLHEIDPNKWLSLFKKNGIINKLIHKDGFLLIVEDNHIPTGEKAYQKGFLVLDTVQLKELFKITSEDNQFNSSDFDGNGRLKAHTIPSNCLLRIDNTSKKNALISISEKAKSEILKIRSSDTKDYKTGKLHGFWVQQFANAQLSLDEIYSK